MPSLLSVFLCGGLAAALFTCVGLPLALRLFPRALALAFAPALGWATYSAVTLPVAGLIGMSRPALAALAMLAATAGIFFWRVGPTAERDAGIRVPLWIFAAAAVLALAPMAGVLPKISPEGVMLAGPIFDHSKIAMIDEMARLGVPAGNPFFADIGGVSRLSYYYLWHFSAAQMAVLTGAGGWAADAGLTWFTAFASLCLMAGLAVWIAGRISAAVWVMLLAATASVRPLLSWLLGQDTAVGLIEEASGFGGWLFQVSWAPQHVAAAGCAVLAVLLMVRLAQRPSALNAIVLGLVAAAMFQSSTWIGGVMFPGAAVAVALLALIKGEPSRRTPFIAYAALAGAIALAISALFIHDQLVTTALRGAGSPIAIAPYGVLGTSFPDPLRRLLDLPAFWLVFLPLEFPAFYVSGIVAAFALLRACASQPERRLHILALCCLAAASLIVSSLFVSTLGENNDLGWRAVLPAVLLLIAFAGAGLSRWLTRPRRAIAAAALAALALGLPEGASLVYSNAVAPPRTSATLFAATPAMWDAVRRHSGSRGRVANNPDFLADMTPWPINISWALMANRSSCYAGADFAGPFVPLSAQRRRDVALQFARIFSGQGTPEDIGELATRYGCDVVLLTAQDGAWKGDPFAANPHYQMVEERPDAWRIYRLIPAVKSR